MTPAESIRLPVSVRLGRLRWAGRMPPLNVHVGAISRDGAQAHATAEVRGGLRFRAALLALKAVVVLLLVPLAWLLRTGVEVHAGEQTP